MSRLKIVLIGLGRMGRVHAQALAKSKTIEVVAVADTSEQSLNFAKSLFGDIATFTDYKDAMRNSRAQSCLIASPTPLHPQMVQDALDNNLHVLCEKPLALDFEIKHFPSPKHHKGNFCFCFRG